MTTIFDTIDSFIPGDWGEDSYSSDVSNAVRCIRGADIVPIKNAKYEDIPQRYISDRSFQDKLLPLGSIVVEKSGGSPTQSTGRVVYISQDLVSKVGNIVCSNFCVAFTIKTDWNPKYVYYYLEHIYNLGVFFNFEGKTSGLRNLQIESAYKSIPIKRIPIDEQNNIVHILDQIDTKAILNRRINEQLEAMAKQLYDYWFVQFDFPNEEGKPYKSSGGKMVWNEKLKREIPEGWEVKELGEIGTFKNGINYDKNEEGDHDFGIVNVRNISSSSFFIDSSDIDILRLKYEKANSYLLKEGDILIARSGNPGATRIFFDIEKEVIYCGFIICFSPHNIQHTNYLSLFLKSREYITKKLISGSIMPNISQDSLKPILVVMPPEEKIFRFNKIIDSYWNAEKCLINANHSLTSLRDFLLPLLMNGQVSIKN